MGNQTLIKWADSTWNPWEGCTKVSAGCQHCYAEARDRRFGGTTMTDGSAPHWGSGRQRRKSKSAVKDAMAFNRKPWICEECGEAFATTAQHQHDGETCGLTELSFHRRRIFSLSLGDWLDDEVPIEWLAEMLDTIRQCDQVTWILCTKRPENWQQRLAKSALSIVQDDHGRAFSEWAYDWQNGKSPSNVILLTSVENQAMADKRIPELLKIPAACRGLSLEPLLGPVDLGNVKFNRSTSMNVLEGVGINTLSMCQTIPNAFSNKIYWLIIGGESGPNARECHASWIYNLIEQGRAAGVATFCKQLGSKSIWTQDGNLFVRKLSDKKGGDINEWPVGFRIQQWPKGF